MEQEKNELIPFQINYISQYLKVQYAVSKWGCIWDYAQSQHKPCKTHK